LRCSFKYFSNNAKKYYSHYCRVPCILKHFKSATPSG
jgi:hypothetical protein